MGPNLSNSLDLSPTPTPSEVPRFRNRPKTPTGTLPNRDLTTGVLAEETASRDQTTEEVPSTDLCAVGPDAGFDETPQVMSENGIRRLPVCDGNDELVGILTADDLTELLADEHQQLAPVIRPQRPDY